MLLEPIPLVRMRGQRFKTFDIGYALGWITANLTNWSFNCLLYSQTTIFMNFVSYFICTHKNSLALDPNLKQ